MRLCLVSAVGCRAAQVNTKSICNTLCMYVYVLCCYCVLFTVCLYSLSTQHPLPRATLDAFNWNKSQPHFSKGLPSATSVIIMASPHLLCEHIRPSVTPGRGPRAAPCGQSVGKSPSSGRHGVHTNEACTMIWPHPFPSQGQGIHHASHLMCSLLYCTYFCCTR